MSAEAVPQSAATSAERPVAVPRRWDLIGVPAGRLLIDLASAREALSAGREPESVSIARRLLTMVADRSAAVSDSDELRRVDLIHASALTTLGLALRRAEPVQAQARLAAAAETFDRLASTGADLKPLALADYGTVLAELDRLEQAFGVVVEALEALAPVPTDVILRIVLMLRKGPDLKRAEQLLQLALDAGVYDPRLAEQLAKIRLARGRTEQAAAAYVQAGTHHGAQGMPCEALRCFEQAIALVPDQVDAMVGKSFALADLARPQAALETIESVRERHPELQIVRAIKAQLLASLGRVDDATTLLDAGFALSPGDPVLLDARVRVLASTARWEEALTAADESLLAWPSDVELRRLKARILRQLGDQTAAIGLLHELLAEEVADIDDRVEMVLAMVDLDDFVGALAETDHALRITPENPGLLACRAEILMRLGQFDEALEVACRTLLLDSENEVALDAQTQSLLGLRRGQEARDPLVHLLRLAPDSLATRLNLSNLLLAGEEYAEVERLLVEGLQIHQDDPQLLLLQGQIRIVAGEYTEALALLETAAHRLKEGADDAAIAVVHAYLGEALRHTGRDSEALAHLDRALENAPGYAFALGTKGQVLRALGDPAAEEYLDRAISEDESLAWVHTELGELLRTQRRLIEALKSLTTATELAPNNPWPWGCRGATEHALAKYDEAASSLDRALALDDEYAWAWAVKGALLMDLDELESSLRSLDRAVELDPSIGWAWTLRGWTHEILGGQEKARESFQQAIAVDDSESWALIGLADLLLQQGRSKQAKQGFRDALRKIPAKDAAELAQVGWCYLRLDECGLAARKFGEALLLDEDFLTVRFDLALALFGIGPVERAVDAYAGASIRARAVAHPGRRSAVLRAAEHDLLTVLTQPAYGETDELSLDVIRWLLQPDGPAAPEWREAVKGTLTPTSYTCNIHKTDLTAEVSERVWSDPTLVANFGFSFHRKNKRADQPFTVIVRCPGIDNDAQHDIQFEGRFHP